MMKMWSIGRFDADADVAGAVDPELEPEPALPVDVGEDDAGELVAAGVVVAAGELDATAAGVVDAAFDAELPDEPERPLLPPHPESAASPATTLASRISS